MYLATGIQLLCLIISIRQLDGRRLLYTTEFPSKPKSSVSNIDVINQGPTALSSLTYSSSHGGLVYYTQPTGNDVIYVRKSRANLINDVLVTDIDGLILRANIISSSGDKLLLGNRFDRSITICLIRDPHRLGCEVLVKLDEGHTGPWGLATDGRDVFYSTATKKHSQIIRLKANSSCAVYKGQRTQRSLLSNLALYNNTIFFSANFVLFSLQLKCRTDTTVKPKFLKHYGEDISSVAILVEDKTPILYWTVKHDLHLHSHNLMKKFNHLTDKFILQDRGIPASLLVTEIPSRGNLHELTTARAPCLINVTKDCLKTKSVVYYTTLSGSSSSSIRTSFTYNNYVILQHVQQAKGYGQLEVINNTYGETIYVWLDFSTHSLYLIPQDTRVRSLQPIRATSMSWDNFHKKLYIADYDDSSIKACTVENSVGLRCHMFIEKTVAKPISLMSIPQHLLAAEPLVFYSAKAAKGHFADIYADKSSFKDENRSAEPLFTGTIENWPQLIGVEHHAAALLWTDGLTVYRRRIHANHIEVYVPQSGLGRITAATLDAEVQILYIAYDSSPMIYYAEVNLKGNRDAVLKPLLSIPEVDVVTSLSSRVATGIYTHASFPRAYEREFSEERTIVPLACIPPPPRSVSSVTTTHPPLNSSIECASLRHAAPINLIPLVITQAIVLAIIIFLLVLEIRKPGFADRVVKVIRTSVSRRPTPGYNNKTSQPEDRQMIFAPSHEQQELGSH